MITSVKLRGSSKWYSSFKAASESSLLCSLSTDELSLPSSVNSARSNIYRF